MSGQPHVLATLHQKKSPVAHWIGNRLGATEVLDIWKKRKHLLMWPVIETGFLRCTARGRFAVLITLLQLPEK